MLVSFNSNTKGVMYGEWTANLSWVPEFTPGFYYGPPKRTKRPNNNLQIITQKTKDRATGSTIKPRCELGYSWKVSSSFSIHDTLRVTVKRYQHHVAIYSIDLISRYNIMWLQFVIDLWKVGGFILVLRLHPPIILRATI
jgi:hypothetical protein